YMCHIFSLFLVLIWFSLLSPLFPYTTLFRSYCAPSPFRAGSERTSFIFNMSSEGSAALSIYLLPALERVFSTTLEGLQAGVNVRSEEHTSELQSLRHLVCRLLLEKKKSLTNK